MGTLSLMPLSASVCCSLRMRSHDSASQKTHFSDSVLRPQVSSSSSHEPKTVKLGPKTVAFGANSSDQNESIYMDENGVVDDMDGYLNYLSLEYDSVWDTKPSWCQPWTIVLTGALVIACSWLIFHSLLASTVVSLLIGTWWYIFLHSYPKAHTDMITERRKRVRNGTEDTFGLERSQ